jgi:nitrogen fixation/metabolism regulation signal transduction histidine kinase
LDEGLIFVIDDVSQRTISVGTSLAFSLEMQVEAATSWTDLNTDLNVAASGDIVVKEHKGVMQALVHVGSDINGTNAYLWIGKEIDQNILKHVTTARDSTRYYNKLLESNGQFQLVLITLFALSSLLLLLASIWVGLFLANILIEPIKQLIAAANNVSNGDLSVRIRKVYMKNELGQLVESFNRMTERLEQQNRDIIVSEKKSAWADIARKIAHEVKNPLTPIQLAAERIKRKYGGEIRGDVATFERCIDTIIRQVSHIENLISEFSAFARMPEAIMVPVDIAQLVRDAIFLQKQTFPEITFLAELPVKAVVWPCDGQQMSQVLTNLLKNAANAITEGNNETRNERSGSNAGGVGNACAGEGNVGNAGNASNASGGKQEKRHGGEVVVTVQQNGNELRIIVKDDGPGFPKEGREKLFEPYYTTRKNGTGLGMAIVLRIVTEHSGVMELKDAECGGAMVEMRFPWPSELCYCQTH